MPAAALDPAVSGDHSLDEFLGGTSGGTESDANGVESGRVTESSDDPDAADTSASAGSEGEDTGTATADSDTDATRSDAVDPAEPTYAWSPDGGTCAACGETAETRWRHEGAYVCPDCKEW